MAMKRKEARGSPPMHAHTRRASTCSVTFMVPMSAAIAAPTRAADHQAWPARAQLTGTAPPRDDGGSLLSTPKS